MKTSLELRSDRANLVEKLKGALDASSEEQTAEERQEIDKLDSGIDKLDAEIRRVERIEKIEADDAEIREREERERESAKGPGVEPEDRKIERASNPLDTDEYRGAFDSWVRGRELDGDEKRALSVGTDAAGGFTVPTSFERQLIELLREDSVVRGLSRVLSTSSGEDIELPRVATHGDAAWTAEANAFNEDDDTFEQDSLSAYKATAIVTVSEELLEDSAFDIESYIRAEFATRIGALEGAAYASGDGTAKPTGVTVTAQEGKEGTAGQTTTVTGDDLIDLVHSVKTSYRRNGTFVCNDDTFRDVRKLKDQNDQYLWVPGLRPGAEDTLLGYPILSDPDIPVMAASAHSIVFGDFGFYWIRDVAGVRFQRLNELYAATGQVGFRAWHRTDGKLVRDEAIKHYANPAA